MSYLIWRHKCKHQFPWSNNNIPENLCPTHTHPPPVICISQFRAIQLLGVEKKNQDNEQTALQFTPHLIK